jgi:CRISPR-associated RAMP protein (TIGR02581 family)
MKWMSHSRILRNIEIRFKYENLEPLRIGAGRGKTPTSPVDLQVLKISLGSLREIPYIPGSSLKGVFRSTAEKLAISQGLSVCYMGEGCKELYDRELQNSVKRGSEDEILKILSQYCVICRLFGTASYSAHVKISDAYPDTKEIPTTAVKTGIAIERRAGGTKKGALYQVEFVNPGGKFYGSVMLHNFPNYGIGLLAEIIEQINLGFVKIGGFKSRGFGSIKISIESLKGIVLTSKGLIDINDVTELEPLDEWDEKVTIDPKNPKSLLENSKIVWNNYCNKLKTKK